MNDTKACAAGIHTESISIISTDPVLGISTYRRDERCAVCGMPVFTEDAASTTSKEYDHDQ